MNKRYGVFLVQPSVENEIIKIFNTYKKTKKMCDEMNQDNDCIYESYIVREIA
ncbi:hypothetical protein [Arcobacter arenosus]|uniref:hypothetical protein n=1 Tax=Arcobacter arenosus TaxID=2576037 RepID=UPI001484EFA4|nr:hypothetical protein [Arcobacter arenosus]